MGGIINGEVVKDEVDSVEDSMAMVVDIASTTTKEAILEQA